MAWTLRAERAPSIEDVAALAQVSVPTVSRYLNTPERVSEAKAAAIASAIAKLRYRPNPIARALVGDRTQTIAVVTTDTAQYGRTQTLTGIEQEARVLGYALLIVVPNDQTRRGIRQGMERCLDRNPDGIVVINYDAGGKLAVDHIPEGTPAVVIAGDRCEEFAQISLCEHEGGYAVTRHLLELGHRTVHHVANPGGGDHCTRDMGWRQALEEAGAAVPTPIETTWDAGDARAIGRRLADDGTVTAVFAGNDELAMGVIRGLTDAGRRVPEDVSVVGFDDHPLSRVWKPAITTVRQDFARAGRAAVTMLEAQIEDVRAGRGRADAWSRLVRQPGELVVRESSAPPSR